MGFNETAVLLLFLLCGGALFTSFAAAGGLALSIAADAGRGLARTTARVRGRWRVGKL